MDNTTTIKHSIISYNLYYLSFGGLISILCFIRLKHIVNNLISDVLYNNDISYNNNIVNNNNNNKNKYKISNDEENNFDSNNNDSNYDDLPPCYNDLFKNKN